MASVKEELFKTRKSYSEEFKYLGRIYAFKLFLVYHIFSDGFGSFTCTLIRKKTQSAS